MIVVVILQSTTIFSQQRLFTNQQHFGVEDGLPQSFITSLVQDDDGFIWFSTFDGLTRYDGRGFKTFRYNPKDSNSLSTGVIVARGKLEKNLLTLYYSPTEMDEFNVRTFKATRNSVRKELYKIPGVSQYLFRSSFNTSTQLFFMAGNKGVGWIDYVTKKISFANKANGLLRTDTAFAIAQAPDGRIFVVNGNSVQIIDTTTKKNEFYPFKTNVSDSFFAVSQGFESFSINYIHNDRIGVIQGRNLILLDVKKRTSTVIPIPKPSNNYYAGYNSMLIDTRGRIYFEDYGRIFRLNENDELVKLWEDTGVPDRISAFYIDRSDVLWVSVNAQGLLKIDLNTSGFESYRYTNSFASDMLNRLGTPAASQPMVWRNKLAGYFLRQATDSKGNTYYANAWTSRGDVFQYSSDKGLRKLPHIPSANSLTYGAFVIMPKGELWAFIHGENKWYIWKDANSVPELLLIDEPSLLEIEPADAKYFGNFIWLTTYTHGLIQMDSNKVVAKYAGQQPNGIMPLSLTEICADPFDKNKFWIGSRSGGLILWDVQKGLQRVYTTNDGLPNNTVYCILPDKSGNLWCSTNKGIFRFNPTTGEIRSFERTDGLAGNEFNRAHKFALPDGKLAFGGLDGYTILDPNDFSTSQKRYAPQLMLTGLQINNEPQNVDIPNSIIKESLSTLTSISLPYNKNYLRFEFAALQFNQPQKIKYRYQLKGIDGDWIENGNSNLAAYSALAPGRYTFRINATDANGLWIDTVKEISVRIRPPFWATWWAWGIYTLIAAALIRWYFVFRERRLKIQQHLAFEKREAVRLREVDELKDRFFSNITHEFRTPLTLIITPLEKLAQDPSLSMVAVANVKTAQRNSKQLLRLINEFLDFSKLNSGQLKLKVTAGELVLFTEDCVQAFQVAAKEKNIDLEFEVKGVEGNYLFDEDKWEKIVSNLVNNALKFTPQQGAVNVSLSRVDDENVQLVVKDNGSGISDDQREKIFTRFYQVDNSAIRSHGGTGIGLSLVKELTDLMGGSIELDSEPGIYSRFVVTVPMRKIAGNDSAFVQIKAPESIAKQDKHQEEELPLLLVVEDNDELRAFLVEAMQHQYRVMEAADGLKAWDIVLKELPDMVISDVMMPGQDGYDLCKQCKEDSRTAHIAFVLLTSKAAHEAVLKGLGSGADDYITKPFNLQELELRIANLFQLQQKQREWLQLQLNHAKPADPLPVVTDPFLTQLYKEIETKLMDSDLGVDYLCKAMAMSRSTLNRKLKSLLSISPNDLIRQQRLQKASSLILAGSDIASAAYQTGFSSPSYFSQCFKEQYGVTPSDWLSSRN